MGPLALIPSRFWLGGIAVLAAGYVAWWWIDSYGDGREAEGRAAVQAEWDADRTRLQAEIARRNDEAAAAAGRYAALQARQRQAAASITQEVERVVQTSVYRDQCFDADGLRVLSAAIDGAPVDPGQPAAAVPGASAPR